MRFLLEPFLVSLAGFSVDGSRATDFPRGMESNPMLLEVVKAASSRKPTLSLSSLEGVLKG
jgi:hypothetical protein